jgi:nonsense-mediated mRNA decay protein 3
MCADCYVETAAPLDVPEHLSALVCGSCGAMLRGKTWGPSPGADAVVEEVLGAHTLAREGVEVRNLSWSRGRGDERSFLVEVRARLAVAGTEFERSFVVQFKLKPSICDVCSRKSGSYYEAILQVRAFDGALPDDHRERIRKSVEDAVAAQARKEREVFLTKVEEVHGGLDFYLSSTSAGQRIAASLRDELSATLTRSGKIAGARDGAELQRTTFSVRLPRFIRGDPLVQGERMFRVLKVHPHSVVVTDLETGAQESHGQDWVKRARVPGKEATLEDAVVVSIVGQELQVLDPVSLQTVTLSNWARIEPGSEKVATLRYQGRLYLMGAPD